MQDQVKVLPIAASETLELRQKMLRPHQTLAEVRMEGDEDAETGHFGAFREGRLVGIATVMRQAHPSDHNQNSWRLRGMAVLPEAQAQGCGKRLVQACLDHARSRQGRKIWCHARVPAIGFYEKLGFDVRSDVFESPGTGPHVLMVRHLDETSRFK